MNPSSFLAQQKHFHQSAVKIDDTHTEFLTCEYGDRLWILITQTDKPGTVTLAENEKPAEAQLMDMMIKMSTNSISSTDDRSDPKGGGMAIYDIRTLFGGKSKTKDWDDDDNKIDLEQVLSRQLLQLVASDKEMVRRRLYTKPILLFLGLQKTFESEALRKTNRGRDYLKLIVDFTRQTLLA